MPTARDRLNDLNLRYQKDPAFDHLRDTDIQFVAGTGVLQPTAMMIGEAPGSTENARGIPFVGNAGAELSKLLNKANIDISNLYMTNVVKYWTRTPGRRNRAPSEQEIDNSKSYLLEEIDIVDPDYVALCGRIPSRTIFPNLPSVEKANGEMFIIDGRRYVILFHPAAILYQRDKAETILSGYRTLANLIKAIGK